MRHLNASKEALFKRVGHFEAAEDDQEVEVAFQWNTGYHEGIHSFANGIATIEGGMHEEGFKKALTNVVNKYARAKGLLKEKDDNLLGEDIREGLTAIISVKLARAPVRGPDQGQARQRLASARSSSGPPTRSWPTGSRSTPPRPSQIVPEGHPGGPGPHGRPPGPRRHPPQVAARGRRPARQAGRLLVTQPARSPSCSSSRATRAGGSAIKARDPSTQAILPIRGKILNVERARIDKMLKNTEIQSLISAIGAGLGDEFDVAKIRYHKVIILADADVDGTHIRTLLLTFFFRQMKALVEQGHVYIAQPPLYSTMVGKEKIYLKDDAAQRRASWPSNPNKKHEFARLKGLGEMDWAELARHHHGPRQAHAAAGHRRAGRHRRRGHVRSSWARTSRPRKHFIQTNANDVRFLDI